MQEACAADVSTRKVDQVVESLGLLSPAIGR
jgi:hypothetical protein